MTNKLIEIIGVNGILLRKLSRVINKKWMEKESIKKKKHQTSMMLWKAREEKFSRRSQDLLSEKVEQYRKSNGCGVGNICEYNLYLSTKCF